MTMHNREIAAIERLARSQETLAKAMSSEGAKEYRKERLAFENAQGGAKKLAQADKVLAAAEEEAAKIKAVAVKAASDRMAALEDTAHAQKVAFDNERADIEMREKRLEDFSLLLDARESTLNDKEAELKRMANVQTALAGELDRRETKVKEDERDVAERERRVREIEEWREKAPV